MKFYFCETCGKRLTERDIEDGAARNKKLKGVYCSNCAIGVSTLDSIPLTDNDARELVRQEGASKAASSGNRPSAPRRPNAISSHHLVAPHVSRAGKAWPYITLGMVLTVVAVVLLAWGPRDASHEKQEKRSANTGAARKSEEPAKVASVPDHPDEAGAGTLTAVESQRDAPGTPVERGNSATPDPHAKPASPVTPIKPAHTKTGPDPKKGDADPLEAKDADRKGPTAKAKTEGRADSGQDKKSSKGPNPEPPPPDVAEVLRPFDQAMIGGDFALAHAHMKEAVARPANATIGEIVSAAERLATMLSSRTEAVRRGAKSMIGRELKLKTKRGSYSGAVRSVADDQIVFASRYVISGQKREKLITFAWKDLAADQQGAFASAAGWKLAESDRAVAAAYEALGAKKYDAVVTALADAGEHPLAAHLTARARDAKTRAAYEALMKRARSLFGEKQWGKSVGACEKALALMPEDADAKELRDRARGRMRILLVDFGPTKGSNKFGLKGWDVLLKSPYCHNMPIGPGGMRGTDSAKFCRYGVTGPERPFRVGETVMATWHNGDQAAFTLSPGISFTDPDAEKSGKTGKWYSMGKITLEPGQTATTTYVFTDKTAGRYGVVNVASRVAKSHKLILDRIEIDPPSVADD